MRTPEDYEDLYASGLPRWRIFRVDSHVMIS